MVGGYVIVRSTAKLCVMGPKLYIITIRGLSLTPTKQSLKYVGCRLIPT